MLIAKLIGGRACEFFFLFRTLLEIPNTNRMVVFIIKYNILYYLLKSNQNKTRQNIYNNNT